MTDKTRKQTTEDRGQKTEDRFLTSDFRLLTSVNLKYKYTKNSAAKNASPVMK